MNFEKQTHRIIIFGNSASSMINFRGTLIQHLVARGVDVFALAPGYDDQSRTTVEALGATPIDLTMSRSGKNPFDEMRLCFQLFRAIRRVRPDSIISYFIKPALYGSITAWIARTPVRIALIEGLGYSFQKSSTENYQRKLLRLLVTLISRFALTKASKILVLNEDDRQQLIDMNAGHSNTIENIGGIGVDLADFAYQSAPEGPLLFLCAARLIKEKGIVDFADAARSVKRVRPDVQFVLLGDVDHNPGSLNANVIHEWVSEGILSWPGSVSDVRPWLAACSVFVLPSYYREGVPRSIQEAMAIGRAIITTDNVGCRDTVEPGVNGLIVSPQQPQQLTNAILELAANVDKVVEMGRASRVLAELRYDAKRFNNRVAELVIQAKNNIET